MYKYIFFDLDGTLTKSEFGIMAAAVRALNHFGIEIPSEEILKKFIGPPLYVSFHDFYGLSEEDSQEAIKIYREYYVKEGVYQAPLYNGIKEMLKVLKASGCTLMITTSKPEAMAVTVSKNDEIFDFFDGIIGPALDEHDPNKAILIRRALKSLDFINDSDQTADKNILSQCLVIGDRFYDIRAAREVGMDSIGVLYGYGNEDELKEAGATYIVKEVSDIPGVILH
ncbi:MAG: HAD hydrolase-like protein [Lachnospiraceae bacterium]|nr:HAD hydrolase-like protein [Lachnospiraceae bacterium]